MNHHCRSLSSVTRRPIEWAAVGARFEPARRPNLGRRPYLHLASGSDGSRGQQPTARLVCGASVRWHSRGAGFLSLVARESSGSSSCSCACPDAERPQTRAELHSSNFVHLDKRVQTKNMNESKQETERTQQQHQQRRGPSKSP